MKEPKTLLEAIQYFSDFENCRRFMIAMRWPDGIVRCPTCGKEGSAWLEKARVYYCSAKHPKQKFSLKVGTILEFPNRSGQMVSSHVDAVQLQKWDQFL